MTYIGCLCCLTRVCAVKEQNSRSPNHRSQNWYSIFRCKPKEPCTLNPVSRMNWMVTLTCSRCQYFCHCASKMLSLHHTPCASGDVQGLRAVGGPEPLGDHQDQVQGQPWPGDILLLESPLLNAASSAASNGCLFQVWLHFSVGSVGQDSPFIVSFVLYQQSCRGMQSRRNKQS